MSELNQNGSENETDDEIKATKHRSPNFPVYHLQKALELAKGFHDKYKRAIVPVNLAQVVLGFKEHSGGGNQAVAALKSFNLFEVDGKGKARSCRLTDAAYRILMNSPDRVELLKKAAVAPAIHNELWEKYKGEEHFPDDDLIRDYLLWKRTEGTFNSETVGFFIDNFRSSLRYADLLPSAKIDDKIYQGGFQIVGPADVMPPPAGCDLFIEDKAVNDTDKRGSVPLNSFKDAPSKTTPLPLIESVPPGIKEDVYDLEGGRALLRYPDKLDAGSVEELEEWLKLIIRKMRRINSLPPSSPKTNPNDKQ